MPADLLCTHSSETHWLCFKNKEMLLQKIKYHEEKWLVAATARKMVRELATCRREDKEQNLVKYTRNFQLHRRMAC